MFDPELAISAEEVIAVIDALAGRHGNSAEIQLLRDYVEQQEYIPVSGISEDE